MQQAEEAEKKAVQRGRRKGRMMEAQILSKTYRDRLTVIRKQHEVAESGESVLKDVIIYNDVPCALSKGGLGTPEKDENRRTADYDMTIFAAPEVVMKDMDSIVVQTPSGQVFKGVSGRTFSYAGSHGETPVRIETMA